MLILKGKNGAGPKIFGIAPLFLYSFFAGDFRQI